MSLSQALLALMCSSGAVAHGTTACVSAAYSYDKSDSGWWWDLVGSCGLLGIILSTKAQWETAASPISSLSRSLSQLLSCPTPFLSAWGGLFYPPDSFHIGGLNSRQSLNKQWGTSPKSTSGPSWVQLFVCVPTPHTPRWSGIKGACVT